MFKRVMAVTGLCGALLAGGAVAAPEAEAVLREQVLSATWPADIARLAADYRRSYPHAPGAAEVAARGDRAARARQALESKDVNLPRDAFAAAAAVPALRADSERAALADAAAAERVAQAYRDAQGVAADPLRHVAWLHYAAALDGAEANYALSRHYAQQGQMPLAAKYQARAVELGFVLPRELDSVRK